MTYSYSESHTFTRTHAVHIAAKVATDLKRMQRFYDEPSDEWIKKFEAEVIELPQGWIYGHGNHMVSRGMVTGSSRHCIIRRMIYLTILPATMIPDGSDPVPQ